MFFFSRKHSSFVVSVRILLNFKTHNLITMKRIKILTSIAFAVLIMTSCNSINKMSKDYENVSYKVVPEVLETHAGEVDMTLTGSFPEKYFVKKAIVEVTPVLVYEGGETAFETMVLQGEDVTENNKTISYAGGTFSTSGKVPFTEEMKQSELILRVNASMKGKSVGFGELKVADGVIATSTYFGAKGNPILIKDKFKRIIGESQIADIMYLINRANIRGSELKSEDIAALKTYLKDVKAAENLEFVGSEVSSYASPDGALDLNERLSGQRASAAEKFFSRELNRAKVEEAKNEDFVTSKTTAEDWDGFQKLMEGSDIQDKELILRVLSMYQDPVVREKEIKNISAAYKIIADDILPQLRRSKITVNVNKIGFSDEEIMDYIHSNPDTLGLEEVLYAATLTDDLEKQLSTYELALEKAPKCVRAANNIGYVYMEMHKYEESKAAFEKAQGLYDNDAVKTNLAYASLLTDDVAKAKDYFNSVEKPGIEVNKGLGLISIMEGRYQDAVNYYGTETCYNAALAHLLNDDAQGAKTILDNISKDCAKLFYLKAIVGVHVQNEDYTFNNLRAACEKEPKMKDMAKKDLEFAKYFENDTFKSIVE